MKQRDNKEEQRTGDALHPWESLDCLRWLLISRRLTEAWHPLLLCDAFAESLLCSLYFVSPNPWFMLFRILIAGIPLSLYIPYSLLILFSISHSWRRKCQSRPVFLPGKSHGWRSLVGYCSWGCKDSDMTEWLHFLFIKEAWLRKARWAYRQRYRIERNVDRKHNSLTRLAVRSEEKRGDEI